jgi:hypothetical protein
MTLQRPMFPPVDPTRRRFLTQAAGVAAGGAVLAVASAPPALAAAGPASPLVDRLTSGNVSENADPIFAAIEAHKAARVAVSSVVREVATLEGQLADRGVRLSERKSDPQLEALEAALGVAFDAELVGMSAPTTMAGVLALLQYANAADIDGEGWPADLASDDSSKSRSWHYFLIELLAEVLPDIMKGGDADTVRA